MIETDGFQVYSSGCGFRLAAIQRMAQPVFVASRILKPAQYLFNQFNCGGRGVKTFRLMPLSVALPP